MQLKIPLLSRGSKFSNPKPSYRASTLHFSVKWITTYGFLTSTPFRQVVFQLLISELAAGKQMNVWNCHATHRHERTTFASIVNATWGLKSPRNSRTQENDQFNRFFFFILGSIVYASSNCSDPTQGCAHACEKTPCLESVHLSTVPLSFKEASQNTPWSCSHFRPVDAEWELWIFVQ